MIDRNKELPDSMAESGEQQEVRVDTERCHIGGKLWVVDVESESEEWEGVKREGNMEEEWEIILYREKWMEERNGK